MYENHRDNFGRRRFRPDDDRAREGRAYWRDESWRDQSGAGDRYRADADDDRTDWRADWRANAPYGTQADFARRRGYRERQARDDHPAHHHDHDDDRYFGVPDPYADNRQQRYFTGQQNSWVVPESTRAGGYGTSYASGGYGRDYLDRGYGDRDRGFFEKAGDEIASWFGDEDAARRREADHRGRGPKDYVRSDERIRDDVNDRLTEDWRVDASNITVTVDQGEVTLNGTVTARQAKRWAEDIVEDVSGVKHVQNNLRVAETATTGAYAGNWALNQRSAAEGGMLGRDIEGKDATPARH